MTLNRLISELVKISSKHGDMPAKIVVKTTIPAMNPGIETKTILSVPFKVIEEEGVVFIKGEEQ